ncbi:MAG: hypothetical protein V7K67_06680 [Nostoc sp.]
MEKEKLPRQLAFRVGVRDRYDNYLIRLENKTALLFRGVGGSVLRKSDKIQVTLILLIFFIYKISFSYCNLTKVENNINKTYRD